MKCYYTYDNDGRKVLIPMCYSVVHSNDIEDCCCISPLKTNQKFEKERYNKIIESKNKTISYQQSELKHLRKVINNLKQKP